MDQKNKDTDFSLDDQDLETQNQGEDLMDEVIALSGLPDEAARGELESILKDSGVDHENLTLDELRNALIAYLEKQIEVTSN